MLTKAKPDPIRGYIASFPPPVRKKLGKLRETILAAAPGATERISYRMPTFDLDGVLVYFAGYERHIGFYPTGEGIAAFRDQLEGYTFSKGAIQFPLDRELPWALVAKIVRHRVAVNAAKAAGKKVARKTAPRTASQAATARLEAGRRGRG